MTVRQINSTDLGAPVLSGTAGSIIRVLDACLLNGLPTIAVTSIVQTGGVATVTTAVPHQFHIFAKPVVIIEGATPSGYNVEAAITWIGAYQFTVPVNAGLSSPASGTITVRIASSGWTKPFTGTNLAAYKMPNTTTNGHYLFVKDTTTTYATVVGAENMTDINTMINRFPTLAQNAGNLYIHKSSAASGTARNWYFIGTEKEFILIIDQDSSQSYSVLLFGQGNSLVGGDTTFTYIRGGTYTSYSSSIYHSISSTYTTGTAGIYMLKSYDNTQVSINPAVLANGGITSQTTYGNNSGFTTKNCDGTYIVTDTKIGNSTDFIRGTIPCIWNCLTKLAFSDNYIWVPSSGTLLGKTFRAFTDGTSFCFLIEISNTR
ncbi:MAG: hypothetical protein PHC28_15705 [Flavobacterium sp.]|uniref:hypothetical protein n=1 Tax=Flavobacterium sp. TaxID=239 RepID=UPI0026110E94|nr:hypothetical protein [Flavobacterium sp.]MDD5151899.1 hypothetical protein [Flavobacterium sp.]